MFRGIGFSFVLLSSQMIFASLGFAGSGSHGGDPVQIRFAEARFLASKVLGRFSATPREERLRAAAAWADRNRQALVKEVLESNFNWNEEGAPTCARTDLSRFSPINLSLPTCREGNFDQEAAAKLLIHEVVHHFGFDNEEFATNVALAAFAGGVSQPAPSLSIDCKFRHLPLGASEWLEQSFTGKIGANHNYANIDQAMNFNGKYYSFNVYYDGVYSAINFFSRDGLEVYNADAEVGVGNLFSLYHQSPSRSFEGLSIACKGIQ